MNDQTDYVSHIKELYDSLECDKNLWLHSVKPYLHV